MAMSRRGVGEPDRGYFGASGLRRGQVVGGRSYGYGDVDESDYVHPEIEEEGRKLRQAVVASRNQNRTEDGILAGLQQHGPAPGGQKMMNAEMAAALWSIESGLYVTFRSSNTQDCCRIGPDTKCFCGCPLSSHNTAKGTAPCRSCRCGLYTYIPLRPEEAGMAHLTRRKGFDIRTWSAPCRCKHGAASHSPDKMKCTECSCFRYESNWACVVCDKRWEDHTTEMEDEGVRRSLRLPVGDAYRPLAGLDPEFGNLVFGRRNTDGVYELPAQTDHQRRIKPARPQPKPQRTAPALGAPPQVSSSSASARGTTQRGPGTAQHDARASPALPSSCTACSTAFASATAKFCTNCGVRRAPP